jgi:hypothetical protein
VSLALARRAGIAALALVLIPPAAIGSASRQQLGTFVADARDTRGPLDIKQVHGQAFFDDEGTGFESIQRFTVELTTYGAWHPGTLGLRKKNYFVLALDQDTHKRGFERLIFIVFWRGSLHAVVTNGRGGNPKFQLASAAHRRPNALTISAAMAVRGQRVLWAVGSFFTGSASCARTCFDSAPNSHLVWQDLVRPEVAILERPGESSDVSTDESNGRTFPVKFSARDAGGSGLAKWVLARRLEGQNDWTPEAEGTGPVEKTVDVTFPEGLNEFRVEAVDGQGTRAATILYHLSVPFDDNSPALLDGYRGAWILRTDDSNNYEGSIHQSAVPGDSLTYSWSDSTEGDPSTIEVMWIGHGGDWQATVDIDGRRFDVEGSPADGTRSVVFEEENFSTKTGTHSIIITVALGAVPVDGLYVWERRDPYETAGS